MLRMRNSVLLVALSVVVLALILMSGAGLQAAPAVADIPQVITTIPVGGGNPSNGPEGIAVDTVRNHIYVANSLTNAVYVIDGDTNAVSVITNAALVTPWGMAYDSANDKVYVASNYRNSVLVIDAATQTVVQEISTPR